MIFTAEQARTQSITAEDLIRKEFPSVSGPVDAEFLGAGRTAALGVSGLPYPAPVCEHLMNTPLVAEYISGFSGSQLIAIKDGGAIHMTAGGSKSMPAQVEADVLDVVNRVLASPGKLNEKGELVLDLKAYSVGSHFPINLLLGDRSDYPEPLYTTPKSALDGLGRGSFRAAGPKQVLSTRYVLSPEENGEPANRQFYLFEAGKQIFYSCDVNENVFSATCVHSQNRSVITYETKCGLTVRRTIFLLPQEDGMPTAVEAQRVEIINRSGRDRKLKIVMTGMFGIGMPEGIANDVVYTNIVAESEIYYKNGVPAAMTLHHKPKECAGEKRFAALLHDGIGFDEFCASISDFIGSGTLSHPELLANLPSRYQRKMAPFFAMGRSFTVKSGETAVIDELVGMTDGEGDVTEEFDSQLDRLLTKYSNPAALSETLKRVTDFWDRYPAYIQTNTADDLMDTYIGHNLPFQVLYQTYVSRSFAWTQKSYRETGFREIQDIFASMYYLVAVGKGKLVRELISNWVRNVFEMGYAYHDFTVRGKNPGDCSDDQLWLLQAVYRYVKLTGDTEFLTHEYPMAGSDKTRPLWDTIMAILTYSGKISIGAHGMPLLDKADWNDTLRLDHVVMQGPEKEALYRKQLREKGQPWGTPLENTLSESVMNACLFVIAADAATELGAMIGKDSDVAETARLSKKVADSIQKNAWKDGYFARCLLNDDRKYKYLGAKGDGLSLDPNIDGSYYLNSYSWSILANVATEEQIASMLDVIDKYLKTEAGLKLCTLVNYDLLGVATGTALYFPGDRENGGVFKHAAMMATVASLKAAKWVRDEALARRLAELAFFMIDRTVPYGTMKNPFVLKGNPRFCTQYNNSETCENIGPMLSGTASWLNLAVYEFLGIDISRDLVSLSPVMLPGRKSFSYAVKTEDMTLEVEVVSRSGAMRVSDDTLCTLDEMPSSPVFTRPRDGGIHRVRVEL